MNVASISNNLTKILPCRPLFSDFMLPESNNDDNTGTSDTGADVKSVTYNPSSFFELADDGGKLCVPT